MHLNEIECLWDIKIDDKKEESSPKINNNTKVSCLWTTTEKKEKKKRKIVVHRNTMKKKRNTKRKNDYFGKEEMLQYIINFHEEKDKDIKKENLHKLFMGYVKICNKLINSKDFRRYDASFKEDLVQDALCRGLFSGVEGYSNYGIPYIMRFDYGNNDNPLSFLTQMAKNFFFQYLNNHYQYAETKKGNLIEIVNMFDIENIREGNKGVSFNYASVSDKE